MASEGFNPGTRGQIYPDIMFNRATADTTLTSMNKGVTTTQGDYSPRANGYLLKIILILTPQASTSLAQTGYVQLTCTTWQPINTIVLALDGFGLATAPQAQNPNPQEFNLNLPVEKSTVIQGSDIFQYSPVTPALWVQGIFWAT